MIRLLAALSLSVLLAACGSRGKPRTSPSAPDSPPPALAAPDDDPCALVYEHDEADYTPGGLYRPGQRDHAPIGRPDLSRIPEPVPRAEPRSRYGNRSPYTVLGRNYHVLNDARGYRERGIASWYGAKFHGRATSSMEPYDMCAYTAAHKTLPLPSYARVTHLGNGRSVIVRVNDRGPFHPGRVVDLSYVAALKLGIYETGTAQVEVEAIGPWAPVGAPVAPAPPPEGRLYLQLGAFAERDNARALQRRLAGHGERTTIRREKVEGRDLYRVRLGPMDDMAELEQIRRRLAALGFASSPIVIAD